VTGQKVRTMLMNNSPGGIKPDPYQNPISNIIADLLIERGRLIELLRKNNIDPKTGEKRQNNDKEVNNRKKRVPLNIQKITKKLKKSIF